MRVATVCSSQAEREEIQKYVKLWGAAQKIFVESTGYESGQHFLYSFTDETPLDLVLISVEENSELSGVALARIIRACNEAIGIVLISDTLETIYEGYEVTLLYYLLRPLKKETVEKCLELQEKKMEKGDEKLLLVKNKGRIKLLKYQNIIYVMANGRYTEIYTKTGMIKIRKPFGELKNELPWERFVEIHRSYIVNIEQIEEFNGERLCLKNGKYLPVSRTKKKELIQMLFHFYKK